MNKFKIISFLILTSFSSFSFAGAAEDRSQSIIDQALSTKKYSSAQGNFYTVGGVLADNGKLVATVSQKVVVDGSAATVTQKVSIPANDAFYRNTAKYAKNIFKSTLYSYAASAAMQTLLDGVGYVMGEGGQIQRPPTDDESLRSVSKTCFTTSGSCSDSGSMSFTMSNLLTKRCAQWKSTYGTSNVINCSFSGQTMTAFYIPGGMNLSVTASIVNNPSYNPSAPQPDNITVPDSTAEDAFGNWLKNNSKSVTDPVTTYIYSPKTSTGAAATTPQNNPSFGQQEITDEMMDNYLANRNAELYANDVAANQAAIRDSAQTETESNPDGTTTTTKNNPDGSKTETKTETKTNPETREVETTVTETVINPDGSRGESKQTETKTETKPNPETSDLPAACEYFAVLCDWLNWTKENPDTPDEDPLEPQELDIGSLDTSTFQATAGCPADIQVPVSFGGASKSIAISYEPICALAQKWSFIAPLIGFISGAMILIGVGRKGEDGDS